MAHEMNAEIPVRDEIVDFPAFALRLSMARGMDEIVDTVRTGVRGLTGADGVTFVLREGDICHYADEDAISPLWKGRRFPAEQCISGWAMIHRQPAVIEDIYKDPRIPHDAYRLTFVRSMVMVPVCMDDPIAAIGAYWATVRRPSEAEVAILQAAANAAAVAMTNVALMTQLRTVAAEAERRAAELAALHRQKSRFLAACSHDLRQPFQAMRLYHTVLAERVAPAQRAPLDGLGAAMAQGEELLHSLLEVSTIESGLSPVAPTDVALGDVFERLRVTHAGPAAEKGLRLSFVASGLTVRSDPVMLVRILGNLVANAIKYTHAGGVVVGARRGGGHVTVQVWDTGIGIDAEHVDQVFEDFYQVGNPERDKRRGIGLGLSIVRRLAERLGHPVAVRSIPERGSVFSVTVPAAG
ncbi:MAG: ATP-binding protein [Actinomycetota bacterium]